MGFNHSEFEKIDSHGSDPKPDHYYIKVCQTSAEYKGVQDFWERVPKKLDFWVRYSRYLKNYETERVCL